MPPLLTLCYLRKEEEGHAIPSYHQQRIMPCQHCFIAHSPWPLCAARFRTSLQFSPTTPRGILWRFAITIHLLPRYYIVSVYILPITAFHWLLSL